MRAFVVIALVAAYFAVAFLSYGQVDAATPGVASGYGVEPVTTASR